MLYSHNKLYTYTSGNIFNTIKASGQRSLEKYTSHFIERVVCERWVGDWTELQHIDPTTLLAITAFLSRSPWLLNGGLGAQPLWDMVLILASSHQLTRTSCAPSYIIVLRPLNSNRLQSTSDILDRMHLLFTQMHILFWQLGRVGGQYATVRPGR